MKNKLFIAICICFMSICSIKALIVSNPVIKGDWSDPGVLRVGEDYYSVRSTFGWQPGLQIMHSKDLLNWEYIGHGFQDENEAEIRTGDVFNGILGSDMIYNPNTKEYLIYAPINFGHYVCMIYVFHSKNPSGPYSPGIRILENDIDPGAFVDNDGSIYLTSKKGNIYKLTENGLTIDKKISKITTTDLHLKAFGEGPEINHHGNYYYYTCSEGGTLPYEHQKILSFRSKTIYGPWEPNPNNPIKYSVHTTKSQLQGPGHAELFDTQNGEWYMTYFAYELDYPSLARQMCMEPIVWTNDGWWKTESGEIPPLTFRKPNLPKSNIKLNQSDDFSGKELGPQWFFHTKPDYSNSSWTLAEKKGFMRLKNYYGAITMTKKLQRFMMQRLEGKSFEITTRMKIDSFKEGEMSGLLMYSNMENYIQYGLYREKDKTYLRIRYKAGVFNAVSKNDMHPIKGITQTFDEIPYSSSEIYLKIKVVDPETAKFYYSSDNINWKTFEKKEIFFGRAGMPDLGWQHTYWTGTTMGIFIDSDRAQLHPSYADFDYYQVKRNNK